MKVHPFRLSEPVQVAAALAPGAAAARLHLLLVASGEVVGRTFVDVVAA